MTTATINETVFAVKAVDAFSDVEKFGVALVIEAKKRLYREMATEKKGRGEDGRVSRRFRQVCKFYFALPGVVRNAIADVVDYAGITVDHEEHNEYQTMVAEFLVALNAHMAGQG